MEALLSANIPTAPPPTAQPRFVTDALYIVRTPEQFHNQDALRASAWATLKGLRGQTVDQLRICRMQRAMRAASAVQPMIGGV